jgi:hypothetical protein
MRIFDDGPDAMPDADESSRFRRVTFGPEAFDGIRYSPQIDGATPFVNSIVDVATPAPMVLASSAPVAPIASASGTAAPTPSVSASGPQQPQVVPDLASVGLPVVSGGNWLGLALILGLFWVARHIL